MKLIIIFALFAITFAMDPPPRPGEPEPKPGSQAPQKPPGRPTFDVFPPKLEPIDDGVIENSAGDDLQTAT